MKVQLERYKHFCIDGYLPCLNDISVCYIGKKFLCIGLLFKHNLGSEIELQLIDSLGPPCEQSILYLSRELRASFVLSSDIQRTTGKLHPGRNTVPDSVKKIYNPESQTETRSVG